MKRPKLVGLLVLVVMMVTLVWQNREPVETRILFQTVTMPGALLIFLTSAIGFLCGVLTCLLLQRKSKKPLEKAKIAEPTPQG